MRLVKYSTKTCVPCKKFTPVVEYVTDDMGLDYQGVDITEENPKGIKSVPFLELQDASGEVIASHEGAMSSVELRKWLGEHGVA